MLTTGQSYYICARTHTAECTYIPQTKLNVNRLIPADIKRITHPKSGVVSPRVPAEKGDTLKRVN